MKIKISILLTFILTTLDISACLDKFITENPGLGINANYKPKPIARNNFIKYCLNHNRCNFRDKKAPDYVRENTIKSLTNLSRNKSYLEIDNAIFAAIKNYKHDRMKKEKQNKYQNFINEFLHLFSKKSLLEKYLFRTFSDGKYTSLNIHDYAIEILSTIATVSASGFLLSKYWKKSTKQNLPGDINLSTSDNDKEDTDSDRTSTTSSFCESDEDDDTLTIQIAGNIKPSGSAEDLRELNSDSEPYTSVEQTHDEFYIDSDRSYKSDDSELFEKDMPAMPPAPSGRNSTVIDQETADKIFLKCDTDSDIDDKNNEESK